MFRLGISGQMFDNGSVWEHLEAAVAFGYSTVELRSTHVNPRTPEKTLEEIKNFLIRNNIEVTMLSCFTGNYGLIEEKECEVAFEEFKKYTDLAQKIGAKMVRVWPGWTPSSEASHQTLSRAIKWLKKSAEYAAEKNIRIGIETHHGTLCDTPESALGIIRAIDNPSAGLIFDPANLYQTPVENLHKAVGRLGKYLYNVHIKDIIRLETSTKRGSFPYSAYAEHIGRFTRVSSPPSNRKEFYAHRRIGCGGVDWWGIIEELEKIGYAGALTVESVCGDDDIMPSGRALAEVCAKDLKALIYKVNGAPNRHFVSPCAPGLYTVLSPANAPCKAITIMRLNMEKNSDFLFQSGDLEVNALLIKGQTRTKMGQMEKLDSFYLPANSSLLIESGEEGAEFIIGAAKGDGDGKAFLRKCDLSLPIGDIHQIHGEGTGRREVFFTLNEEVPAARLICGVTFGGEGAWTSWPPHEHERFLEEAYCYFDMDEPKTGLHLFYEVGERPDSLVAYPVHSGHVALADHGYHPTVATPGTRNIYFWVLAALDPTKRSYKKAVNDEYFTKK